MYESIAHHIVPWHLVHDKVEVLRQLWYRRTQENLLPQNHDLQIAVDISRNVHSAWKGSGDNSAKALGRFVYGLSVKDPIDRFGTYPLGFSKKDDSQSMDNQLISVLQSTTSGFDPTSLLVKGIPRFSWTNLTSVESQMQIIEHCERIGQLHSVARDQVSGKGQVQCDVKCWLANASEAF